MCALHMTLTPKAPSCGEQGEHTPSASREGSRSNVIAAKGEPLDGDDAPASLVDKVLPRVMQAAAVEAAQEAGGDKAGHIA